MNDIVLAYQAKKISPFIVQIDESWRTWAQQYRESFLCLPFPGNYRAQVYKDAVCIEACRGPLSINKIMFYGTTYAIVTPLEISEFVILGVYDFKRRFKHLVTEPELGCHYSGYCHSTFKKILCTGELVVSAKSYEELRNSGLQILKSLELINVMSLGEIVLPDESPIKTLLNMVKNDVSIQQIIESGLIKPLL